MVVFCYEFRTAEARSVKKALYVFAKCIYVDNGASFICEKHRPTSACAVRAG